MKDKFEEHIKKSLEQHSVQYDAQAWTELSKQLDAQSGLGLQNKTFKVFSAVAFVGLAAVLFYFSKQQAKLPAEKPKFTIKPLPVKDDFRVQELNPSKPIAETSEEEFEQVVFEKSVQNTSKEQLKNELSELENDTTQQIEKEVAPEVLEKKHLNHPELKPLQALEEQLDLSLDFSADFSISKKRCAREIIAFKAADQDCASCIYTWYFGDGNTANGPDVKYIYANEGSYEVKLEVRNKKIQKENKAIFEIFPLPSKDFDVNYDEQSSAPRYLFSYAGQDAQEVKWAFPDQEIKQGLSVNKSFLSTGNKEIKVAVTNMYGCKLVAVIHQEVNRNLDLMAPTGFSPNGDGQNDDWLPELLRNGTYTDFTIQVFDRHKRPMFSSSNPLKTWMGEIQGSSEKANTNEIYLWHATVVDPKTKQNLKFQGSIYLSE